MLFIFLVSKRTWPSLLTTCYNVFRKIKVVQLIFYIYNHEYGVISDAELR